MFNFFKKKGLNHKSSDFEELIKYGIEMSGKETVNVSSYQFLIYLQKIICNSISYNDYVYRILQSPHNTPRVELADFLPTNSNYTCINLEKPIYINAKDNPLLTLPWHHNRVVNNILTVGEDAGNPIDTSDINIDNVYIYPLGITLVSSGNHSQFAGILKSELENLKINRIYDISEEMSKVRDNDFSNFSLSLVNNKINSILQIGAYLERYSDDFPKEILGAIYNEQLNQNKVEEPIVSYRDKVLTEYSNTAYLRITGDSEFKYVPKEIFELWYSQESDSIYRLQGNYDEERWKELYKKFQIEFSKLMNNFSNGK